MTVSKGKSHKKFLEDKRLNTIYAKPGPFEYRIVLDGLKATYNIGKIFRSAQAFGANGIDLCRITTFNPYPALGALRYVPARFHEDFKSAHDQLRADGYTLFAMDVTGEGDLTSLSLPKKSAFVFGHEEFGFSFKREEYPGIQWLRIPMHGQVQSLNVSIAASVLMFEYTRQHRLERGP